MGASDPMLLTLPRPANSGFEFKHAHDFIPPPPPISFRRQSSTQADKEAGPSLQASSSERMGTPHRGLPPPSAMTLDPGRSIPPPLSTSFGGMPEPPRQWQGAEDGMRNWLSTKAEEEKRRQEEERTKQEALRVEQRKIEQTMLMDALRSGIPPQLVPIIFAGVASQSVAGLSVELLQQYNNSLHAAAQQQPHTGHSHSTGSPDNRRDRIVAPGPHYAAAPGPSLGSAPLPLSAGQQPPAPYGYHSAPLSPTLRAQQGVAHLRGPIQQVLPRLSTNEQPPGALPPPPAGAVQTMPMQMGHQEPPASSPSGGIFFHHWVPPSSQPAAGNQPATPEYTNSPKRRKAPAPQPPSLPPTSEPRYHNASFVHVTSPANTTPGGRKRRLSDTSTSNRPGLASTGRKNRSRGNTESSAAISEEDRMRYRQYPVSAPLEDRGDDRRDLDQFHPNPKRSRRSYDHADTSLPNSPKREQTAGALTSRKSSFGAGG